MTSPAKDDPGFRYSLSASQAQPFKPDSINEEIVLEISVEKDIIVAIMVDEATAWKGTLAGLRQLINGANAAAG
jgi:hypothetical protein